MENGNGGFLVPVSESSEVFRDILAPLQNAYLYEESKHSFRYQSAFLIENPTRQEQYDASRAKRRDSGYSEQELKESFGFLLFDDFDKASKLEVTGVCTGNSTCTTLGDPSKGVYISKYSDCLDHNQWHHGKSGYIGIIKLTKGRVRKVSESDTPNSTAPSLGFDCHESKQLSAVSTKTTPSLAFGRTQYYLYELLLEESNKTAQSPSHACPFAIVPFSYANTEAFSSLCREQSEKERNVLHYILWKGQLHISSQFYNVGMKSRYGASVPVKLPAVLKIDRAASMMNLRQFVPRSVFETCFSGEVFLDTMCCSLYELVPVEDPSLTLLIQELKERDLALTIPLKDSGFLILLHSSNFPTHKCTESREDEALRAMFLFPDSRAVHNDTKGGWEMSPLSSEILQFVPALNDAGCEVGKGSTEHREELLTQFAQPIECYAAKANGVKTASPSREISLVPDEYDVPETLKVLHLAPKWTKRTWQNLKSYLSCPDSFQLPASRAKEILEARHKQKRGDVDTEVDISHTSSEEGADAPGSMCPEDQRSESPAQNTMLHSQTASEAWDSLLEEGPNRDGVNPGLAALTKTNIAEANDLSIPSTSVDLSTEVIVSITSAEAIKDKSAVSALSAVKHPDPPLYETLTDKLQVPSVNCLNDAVCEANNPLEELMLSHPKKTDWKTLPRDSPKAKREKCVEAPSLPTDKEELDAGNSLSEESKDESSQSLRHPEVDNPPRVNWRKLPRKRKVHIPSSKYKKVSRSTPKQVIKFKGSKLETKENISRTELEISSLKKKTERWDLKPIITHCGRTLVPHGSTYCPNEIESLKRKREKEAGDGGRCLGVETAEASLKAPPQVDMQQEPRSTSITNGTTDTATLPDEREAVQKRNLDPIMGHLTTTGPEEPEILPIGNIAAANTGHKHSASDFASKNHIEYSCQVVDIPKSESFLGKLRMVLSKTKRKIPDSPPPARGTEAPVKKSKADSTVEISETDDSGSASQDTGEGHEDVLRTRTQGRHFVQALGLIPKEQQGKIPTSTPQKKDSSGSQDQAVPSKVKLIQTIQRRRTPNQGKLKEETLKKKENVSVGYMKNKWRLRSHGPVSSAQHQHRACGESNSTAKNLQKPLCAAGPSTDALTLLADLALGASDDMAPQKPDQDPERQPDSASEVCDLTTKVIGPGHQTVLNLLLARPVERCTVPPNSSSPKSLGEGKNERDLTNREHSYSMHCPKEQKGSSEYLKEDTVQRTTVVKEGSIQVTRKWTENYDFIPDNKFATDPKVKTVCRALHGSWDFTGKDTSEEGQLIVHIWIGLFYSGQTGRIFDIDSSLLLSEEAECSEVSAGMIQSPTPSETSLSGETSTEPAAASSMNSELSALDLSKKDTSGLNQGADILDLSMKKMEENNQILSSGGRIETTQTPKALKPVVGPQEQTYREYMHSTSIVELDDDVASQRQEVSRSVHSDGTFLGGAKARESSCKDVENVATQRQGVLTAHGSGHSRGSGRDLTKVGENKEIEGHSGMGEVPQVGPDDSRKTIRGVKLNLTRRGPVPRKKKGSINPTEDAQSNKSALALRERESRSSVRRRPPSPPSPDGPKPDEYSEFREPRRCNGVREMVTENNLRRKPAHTEAGSPLETEQHTCKTGQEACSAGVIQSILNNKAVIGDRRLQTGPATSSRVAQKVSDRLAGKLPERGLDSDLTQVAVERDCLLFSEQVKRLLRRSDEGLCSDPSKRSRFALPSPVAVHFSNPPETEDARGRDGDGTPGETTSRSPESSCAQGDAAGGAANSAGPGGRLQTKEDPPKTEAGLSECSPGNHSGSNGQMRREMFDSSYHGLNLVARQSCKTKFRFYVSVTSEDAFFNKTKALLKADGHTEVPPSHFFLEKGGASTFLLIILRNEDIEKHVSQVPHLVELRKCPNVLFAGIDQPDDIANLTHQELFNKGGFIVLERTAMDALRLCDVNIFLHFLQELSKKGKWKWILHYRDMRHLKENARSSVEAKQKTRLMECHQEAGLVEVLSYHDCDQTSSDHPNYLKCLLRLQIQNISARFPVFITDTADISSFKSNGILTTNINSLLTIIKSGKCTNG